MPARWIPRGGDAPSPRVLAMAEEGGVPPLIAEILAARGLATAEAMQRFLNPGLAHLTPPSDIPGLDEAAAALAKGLDQGRTLAVWGDYDVDGVTATAVVKTFLKDRLGLDVRHHLPNRLEEGYGLGAEGIRRLAGEGVDLLLTVDCGITDVDEVRLARELGMEVVVSDHHLPGDALPEAAVVCDPKLADCGNHDLAGVGVAFLLMTALNRLLPGEPVDWRPLLDLVALGTIADVVPLTGPNRILVKNGLLLIKEARRPGIAALKQAAGYDQLAALGAGQIAFGLAPRINAAGRMGDPGLALDTLLAPSVDAALPLAKRLDAMNAERRAEEDRILEAALEQAEALVDGEDPRLALVLHQEDWHPGIIGIVASRVVERHYRPTVLLTRDGDVLKGSGRSIEEFDLHAALGGCAHLLEGYGGHRQAAGLSLAPGNLEAFAEAFHQAAALGLGPTPLAPRLSYDRELPFAAIDNALLRGLEELQPFGMGNPEPVFVSPPVLVKDRRAFGKDGMHVNLTLTDEDSGRTFTGKAWRQAESLPADLRGETLRFAFTPRIDTWTGMPTIELRIKDWNDPAVLD